MICHMFDNFGHVSYICNFFRSSVSHDLLQMDRSWIKNRMFNREHIERVEEFMIFVFQRLSDNDER